jgi:hypothetical protein
MDPGSGSTAKNLSICNQCSEFAGKLDPDMHQSGKLDHDPHHSEKQDPDPIRIEVESRIRICINVMRIRNTFFNPKIVTKISKI